jgi:hypothetical protein
MNITLYIDPAVAKLLIPLVVPILIALWKGTRKPKR